MKTNCWLKTLRPGLALAVLILAGPIEAQPGKLKARTLSNETAYIPSQCYTKTRDQAGEVHNPCYVCHTESRRPNYINDSDLQEGYPFPNPATKNPWTNLFVDRSAKVAEISDNDMLAYIRQSNYFDAKGRIIPARKLAKVPPRWDYNGDGRWDGFVPDIWFNFDEQGFDRKPNGKPSGWRAFGYWPFPGTFWPTNGSTDDVMIRLPEIFRRGVNGRRNLNVYRTNLAIVEAMITETDVPIAPVNESFMGNVDLDKDGKIGTASVVKYDWAPLENRFMYYVGQALKAQRRGEVHLAAGLYPEGTEFLHTVRYIDVDDSGNNLLSARMKEVRYARKDYWLNYGRLETKAAAEVKEKSAFPDRTRFISGNIEAGVSNGLGWTYAGMIENAKGQLRPQTYEELVFCVGCHSGIGGITDGSFAFPRKFPHGSFQDGWYHWSQKGLRGIPEKTRSDGEPEYAYYLANNGAGDEFRGNEEVKARFFKASGELREQMLKKLNKDISTLLFASPERAMQLNKAYRVIAQHQRFHKGRDPTVMPAKNVYRKVDDRDLTGVTELLKGY